jgi:hypothetical protein
MTRTPPVPSVAYVRMDRTEARREQAMAGSAKRFDGTGHVTHLPNGQEQVVELLGSPVGLARFEPGWRWTNDVRPLLDWAPASTGQQR